MDIVGMSNLSELTAEDGEFGIGPVIGAGSCASGSGT
jgi:hypothetical protein